jgi:hypothetical protein
MTDQRIHFYKDAFLTVFNQNYNICYKDILEKTYGKNIDINDENYILDNAIAVNHAIKKTYDEFKKFKDNEIYLYKGVDLNQLLIFIKNHVTRIINKFEDQKKNLTNDELNTKTNYFRIIVKNYNKKNIYEKLIDRYNIAILFMENIVKNINYCLDKENGTIQVNIESCTPDPAAGGTAIGGGKTYKTHVPNKN